MQYKKEKSCKLRRACYQEVRRGVLKKSERYENLVPKHILSIEIIQTRKKFLKKKNFIVFKN